MSIPIRTCEYPLAYENKEAFESMVEKSMQGIYSILPCKCDPPCRELTDREKEILQKRVNDRVTEIRGEWRKKQYEKDAADRTEMTLEDICRFAAKYLTEKTKELFTAQDVYNLNPARNLGYYLELYEEAVFATGKDFYGRSSETYFDERFLTVKDDPTMQIVATRYVNALTKIRDITAVKKA